MEKKPDTTQKPKDHERKLESGLGSHWRSVSALIANNMSWTRVHSSLANIGLWHICLMGYIMPTDPVMKSYVGCWWIHSNEFERVVNDIMPPWFRIIQFLCVITVILDIIAMAFVVAYLINPTRQLLYDKDRGRMFIIDAAMLLVSAFLVFLIAIIFAEMCTDSSWMPRPWMNYLSWSYGLCVLSGFIAAFGGMILFILGLIYKDKSRRDEDALDSAAEMRKREEKAKEKELEASRPPPVSYIPPTRFVPPRELASVQPPVMVKPSNPSATRVGESFV